MDVFNECYSSCACNATAHAPETPSMESAYSEFLERPTLERYDRVQRMVFVDGVCISELRRLVHLIQSGQLDAAMLLQDDMGPTWLLSPSFHLWSARLAESVGDDEGVELGQFQFHACLTCLVSSGDGSQNRPFRVTYTSDIADVLNSLGKEPRGQHVVRQTDGFFDVVTCTDGAELFFARPDLDVAHDSAVRPRRVRRGANLPSLN